MRFTKGAYWRMASKRRSALQQIARSLGKSHEITKMMGERAWGRSRFEVGKDESKEAIIREVAALDGAFDVLNVWARDHDPQAQRVMLEIYPMGFEP